ncbi:MAG: hypothetical protein R2857_15480 [Vampirovibrionales bacterium]
MTALHLNNSRVSMGNGNDDVAVDRAVNTTLPATTATTCCWSMKPSAAVFMAARATM